MAKANSQWRTFTGDQEALVIFQGPHTYISPTWYQTHPSVPTWDYAIVHAYGMPRLIKDERTIHDLLSSLVDKHESAFEEPWPMNLPGDYYRQQTNSIVAFEIELVHLEGKFKMSQNRSAKDRSGVIAALNRAGDDNSIEVAHYIEQANR
jgi:transcriptional regulator